MLVADIRPGSASSIGALVRNGISLMPPDRAVAGDRIFFRATDGDDNQELWVSNGTDQGTVQLPDMAPGMLPADPQNMTVVGNTLFFAADDSQNGLELWALPLPTPAPFCLGDCDADGQVSVDESVIGVNIALGRSAAGACEAFDADEDGAVAVSELVKGVGNALFGCPSE
jgi:ELWxxDGT repeat protein